MDTASKTLGVFGEELALRELTERGYKPLLRNYTCDLGEIDIIAKHQGALVFIEVKSRRSDVMGAPEEAVTLRKRGQIVKTARYYMKRYGVRNVPCRFDVVSVLAPDRGETEIRVIQNAFNEDE